MINFVTNRNNLKESDITETVIRVKALLINSKNEILLGYSHNDYQFPGGHIEENESLIDALNREVEEETGIKLNIKRKKYFACSIGYWKDHPKIGNNRKTIVYYFKINTDKKPNLKNTSYTESEIKGNYTLKYISLDEVENVLIDNANIYGDKYGITKEMLELIEAFKGGNIDV